MTADTVKSFGFTTVSTAAAQEYEDKTSALVAEVDEAMLSRRDLAALVGTDGKELMRSNHKNHAAFISLVLRFNRFDILHSTLPWVYRTYRNQGFSRDYFPHALGFWMEAAGKILSRESASEIMPVYRRMIELHDDSVQKSLVDKQADRGSVVPGQWRATYEKFRKHLFEGNLSSCIETAGEACRDRGSVMDLFLWVIQPSLYWIGDLWERGAVTVA